jgi:hypothetical protein
MKKFILALCLLAAEAGAQTKVPFRGINGAPLNVKDYGAKGDGVADDTNAIKAAVTQAQLYTQGAAIYFPAGIYNVSSTINITGSNIRLLGSHQRGAQSFSPNRWNGSMLMATVSGMGDVVFVNSGVSVNYGFAMEHLRIGAQSAFGSPPNGVHLKDVSEFNISDCQFTSQLNAGVKLNGADIGKLDFIEASTNAIGLYFTINGTTTFTANGSVWMSHLNIFTSSTAHIKVDGNMNNCVLRDSWLEFSPAGFLVAPSGSSVAVGNITVDNVYFANSGASPYANARAIKFLAENTAARYLVVQNFSIVRSQLYMDTATYVMEFLLNGNTNASTVFQNILVDTAVLFGGQTASINTDTNLTSGMIRGGIISQNGFASGVNVAVTAGSGRWGLDTIQFGYRDNTGVPIQLPRTAAISFATEGLINYNTGTHRTQTTDGTNSNTLAIVLGNSPTYGATVSVNVNSFSYSEVVVTNGSAFQITATGAAPPTGTRFLIRIKNTSGGALGALTFSATFKIGAAWVQPANGFSRFIEFVWDGTNAVECGRSAADVTN